MAIYHVHSLGDIATLFADRAAQAKATAERIKKVGPNKAGEAYAAQTEQATWTAAQDVLEACMLDTSWTTHTRQADVVSRDNDEQVTVTYAVRLRLDNGGLLHMDCANLMDAIKLHEALAYVMPNMRYVPPEEDTAA